MNTSPKSAIVQSLDAMDQMQMENVLGYIKNILSQPVMADKSFKKEAMKEIRAALRQTKKAELQFA